MITLKTQYHAITPKNKSSIEMTCPSLPLELHKMKGVPLVVSFSRAQVLEDGRIAVLHAKMGSHLGGLVNDVCFSVLHAFLHPAQTLE